MSQRAAKQRLFDPELHSSLADLVPVLIYLRALFATSKTQKQKLSILHLTRKPTYERP